MTDNGDILGGKSDGSLLIQTIKAKNGIIYYYPSIIYKKSNGDIILISGNHEILNIFRRIRARSSKIFARP